MAPRGRSSGGAWGGAVLERVREALAAGWRPGLTVLTGEDIFHLDAAQAEILRRLVPEEASEFALTLFGEADVDVEDVVSAARSRPMFSARRVVFVRDVGALSGDDAPLAAYAEHPPEDSFLLVRAPKLDLRRPLHKRLAGAGTVLEFRPASEREAGALLQEVVALARERDLSLGREVAAFLLEGCAGDLHRVLSELDKIRAWFGGERTPRVGLDVVREVAAGTGILTGWEVADALLERNAPRALSAARRLVEHGDEPIRIVGGLAWRARTLLRAKAMRESGASARDVIQAARAWAYAAALEAGLARYSLAELLAFPARLLRADRELKSRSLDPRAVLESLVVDLIGARSATR